MNRTASSTLSRGTSLPVSPALRALALALPLAMAAISPCIAQTSTWEPMNRGLQHLLVYTIEVDPIDSLVMFCGTEYGNVYKSTDGGYNWVVKRTGIPSAYDNELTSAMWLDKVDRNLLYVGFGGRKQKQNLFKSTNRGESWSQIVTPASWPDGGILHIYRVTGPPSILYCGLGWYSGVWYSTNEGATWTQVLNGNGVQAIGGHPNSPRNLLAGFSGRKSTGCLALTRDGAATWTAVDTDFHPDGGTGVRAIAFDPSDPLTALAGVTGYNSGLYRTTNLGINWSRLIGEDQISEIAVHPRNPKLIYFSHVYKGVYRSTDGGTTWKLISDGLPVQPNTPAFMRVRIAPGYPVRVFCVTLKHGIYRLVDEELPEDMFR